MVKVAEDACLADGSLRQHTLKSSINCTGVGLHNGLPVGLHLHPAAPDTGIVFRRSDLRGAKGRIAARWDNVHDTTLCTVLRNDYGTEIGTVEHVMAALAGCGVDNAVVEVDGPEVPIMDGSAEPFVFLIDCVGTAPQNAPRRAVRILKPVAVGGDERYASLEPADGFSLCCAIDFDSAAIARQQLHVSLVNGTFKRELSRARTFGRLEDVERMRAMGRARGGSLQNAVVVSGDKVLNEEGLRFDDEFVRHKLLDSLGDLYLVGGPLVGHFHGVCSGHRLNNALLQALFADDEAWCYTQLDARGQATSGPASLEPLAALA
jgi:UDP-3-O-[3-hydroxymyristoyl] N-acetylglucosamine deacetylase